MLQKRARSMRFSLVALCLAVLSVAAQSVRAEDSDEAARRRGPTAGNVLTDAGQFVKDRDVQIADVAMVAADRAAMAVDLSSSGNLRTDVTNFFKDRASVAIDELAVAFDRKQLRVDVKPNTGALVKPPKASTDLNTAVTQFFTDFDARVKAEAAIDTDYSNLKTAVSQSNSAAVTTNANQFFLDRHAYNQNRLFEAADVKGIKKIIKFKGAKAVLVKPAKKAALSVYVQTFLNDRATWLKDADAITAARNNMRSAVGTASLQDAVTTWLNARRTHHVAGVQLSIDRFAMKVAVGLAKVKDVGGAIIKVIHPAKEGAEDVLTVVIVDLDESDEDNGE